MSTRYNVFQLQALPAVGSAQNIANAVYYIEGANGNDAEHYITDAAGNYHDVGNASYVNSRINAAITAAFAADQRVVVYADIAARDADQSNLDKNTLVVVKDASGDSTVNTGAALYVYEDGPDTFEKLAEYESMDIVLAWSNITGRPSSSPAQIDDAVAKRHEHTNKPALDKLGVDNDNNLTINGTAAGGTWTAVNW